MIVLAAVLGTLMGITLGVLGAGGSILAVPIFVYVLGVEAKAAIAMSLAVVGATALVGGWSHGRAGNVRVGVVLIFAPVSMVGTYLGARLAQFISGQTQLLLFAGVLLFAAYFMERGGLRAQPLAAAYPRPEASSQAGFASAALLLLGLQGLVVGVVTGLVGVGGGFLIVPALVLLAGLEMREAVGTSLLVIALNSATGVLGYMDQVSIAWVVMGLFTVASIGGILIGARISRWLPGAVLRRGFSGFLVIMAFFILYMEGLR